MILPDLRQLKTDEFIVEYFDIETGEFHKLRPSQRRAKYERPYRRAGTFGAANDCIKKIISTETEMAAFASLDVANAKRSTRLASPFSPQQVALRNAHVAWIESRGKNWDLAVSLHLPYRLAHTKMVLPETIIEKRLNQFFTRVEKQIFSKTERIRLRKKLWRIVTVENSASVGFHVHMAMVVPVSMNIRKFIEILKQQWNRFWTGQKMTFPREHSTWAQALSGNYVNYSLKNVGTGQAEVLWCSSHI